MGEFNPDRAIKVTKGTEEAPVNVNAPAGDIYAGAKEAQNEIVNKRIQEAQPNFDQTDKTGAMVGAGALATAAGLAMAPQAFIPLVGRAAAPYASALANGAVTAAASLGIDLIGGDYRSPEELLLNAGTAAFVDVASSLVIPPAGKFLAKKIFTTSNKLNSAMAQRASDAQELLSSGGMSLPMGSMEGKSGAMLGFAQSVTDGSMFTEGSAKAARADRVAFLGDLYKGFMNKIGTEAGPVSTGNMLQSMLWGRTENYGTKFIPEGFTKWSNDIRRELYKKSEAFYLDSGITVPQNVGPVKDLMTTLSRFKDTDEIGPSYKVISSYIPEDGGPVKLEDLILAKREINGLISKTGKDIGKFKGLSGASARVNEVIEDTLLSQAGEKALMAYSLADEFAGTTSGVLYQHFAKSVMDTIKSSPETLLPYLASPKDMPSKLGQLENLWNFATEGMQGKVTPADIPTFDDAVKKPLRYYILNQAFDQGTGAFEEGKAWTVFNRYPREIRQYLFGQEADAMWNKVANAGKYLADAKFAEKMVPKMLEGGLLMTMGYQTFTGDQDQAVKAALTLSAFGVMAHGLSSIMSNAKLARSILNDVSEGPGGGRFLQGLFNLEAVSLNEALKAKRKNQAAFDSYVNYPTKKREAAQQQAPSVMPSGVNGLADSGHPLM